MRGGSFEHAARAAAWQNLRTLAIRPVSIDIGSRLGPYEIQAAVGAGGMVRCIAPATRAFTGMGGSS